MQNRLLVITFLFTLNSCGFMDTILDLKHWSHKDEYIGEFKINMHRSDFGEYADFNQYKNLVLSIKEDATFSFSVDFSFLTQTSGKWRMAGDDVSQQCELLYGSKYSYDQVLLDLNGSLFINNPRGKKGFNKAKLLYFDRLK